MTSTISSQRCAPSRFTPSGILVAQVLIAVAFFSAWEVFSIQFEAEFWISRPSKIVLALISWYESGELINDLKTSLTEAGLGYVVGATVGGTVGFVLGWSRKLGDLFEPFVMALYTLPKIALAPLFVLWFGIGITNKVMFASLLVFFMVFFTTYQGVRQVDRDLVENARLMGASPLDIWRKIAVPYAAVWVLTGLRIGLPYALIGAIVGEFIAAEAGIGFRIKEATSYFDTAEVFAGLFLLMGISLTLLGSLKLIEKRVLRWQTATGDTNRQTDNLHTAEAST
jgi:NitT/TauT family transport system permease protein